MKSLIVNADDFGASRGINQGVIEAHGRGVVTSASMMVDAPASEEAARLGGGDAGLDVGLHVVIAPSADSPHEELQRQFERFVDLTGRTPTHIDAHHHVHHDERVLPAFLAVAEQHRVPLRGHCAVHHISSFYGQWDGETHLEAVSPDALARIVATEIEDGFNELCCHPGYVDGDLTSSYTLERPAELETLCDPAVAALLSDQGIRLATFREVARP
jgi:chitin disaccharide deacetylase